MSGLAFLTPSEQEALQRFKGAVATLQGEAEIELRLFGSRARRSGDEESDLDVLVLLDTAGPKTKEQIWDAAYRIFADTDILISPLVLSKEQFHGLKHRERLIAIEIQRDGVIV